jgi:kumamolisin
MRADIVLRPTDSSQLAAYATAVASPHSRLFRHYLSPAKFRQAFAPAAATVDQVRAGLAARGLTVLPTAADGLVIPVRATAQHIDAAFHTTLESVRLASGHTGQWAVTAPELPATIAPSVLAILGLDQLVQPTPLNTPVRRTTIQATTRSAATHWDANSSARPQSGGPEPCAEATEVAKQFNTFTDNQVASAYGLSGLYAKGVLGAGQTVGLFEEDTYLTSDLRLFDLCYFGADHSNQATLINIDGGEPPGPGAGEAALDVEDVSAYAPGADIDVYDAPGTLIGWVDEMAAIVNQDTASVVNVSYGLCETQMAEAAPGLPQTENILFEEAALQGQTFVVASGDAGSETCSRNDNTNQSLSVSDPASQPFATSVGGTSLKSATFPPVETVWNDGGSGGPGGFGGQGAGGGGISQLWPMPSWQSASGVPGVINSYSTGSLCGAPSGTDCREVPEVAASADELHGDEIVYDGQGTTIGGTSAAAPKWVALLALANNYCSTQGLGRVGFVTPALYQIASNPVSYAEAFNDITQGNNDMLGVNDGAYPATKGYDMASGLGSPRVTGPDGSTGLAALLCSAGTSDTSHPVVTSVSPNYGSYAGGTSVTIDGSNLTGVTEVQFGPAAVAVTSSDIKPGGTAITVDTPPSPTQPFNGGTPVGGVLVAASGPKGTSEPTLLAEFHYVAGSDTSPVPSVDYVSPSSASAGSTITVYGSGFEEGNGTASAPTVQFGNVASTTVTVVSDTELTAVVPAEQIGTDCATAGMGVPESSICQVEVTVTNTYGTSATQAILPPPTGLVFDLFIPAPGTENVPAVTEFDYSPTPVITTVSPSTVGVDPYEYYEAGPDPLTPDILTITGTGFNYFSLESVNAVVTSDSSLDQSLFVGIITPTTVEFDAPVFLPPGNSNNPTSFNLSVDSSSGTSNVESVAVAPTNLTVSKISLHDGSTNGGLSVTVTGTGLNAATGAWYVGGPPLYGSSLSTQVTVSSPTELQFLTPAMPADQGFFMICNASVCVGNRPVTDFQYYEPVQPVATSISPSTGSAGGGERVTITGTGLGSVTAVKFGTSLSTRVSNPYTYVGTSTTEVFAAAAPGVVGTKVPVVVVTLAGTSKPAPVEFSYVKGNPGPPVDATVKAAPGMGIVSWSPPLNDGGSPIIGYSISAHTPSYPYKTTTTYSPYVNVPASARSVDLAVPPFLEWTFDVKARTAIGYQTAVTRGIEVPVGDDGYVIGASDGTARAYGDLGNLPAGAGGTKQPSPIVAFAVSPALRGYWTVAADGVVSAYGSSIRTYGSLAPDRHRTPIVTLLPDSTGGGYWIITAGGGVFPFGDARSYGVINQALTSPIVSAARSLDGKGYWMVAANGTVYPFGDAQKAGSLGGSHSPVVSILGDPTADGYWLVTSSGGVHNYGSAKALPPVSSPASPIVSASVTPDGGGAWLLESNGTVKAVGDALFEGDLAGRLEAQAVSISA